MECKAVSCGIQYNGTKALQSAGMLILDDAAAQFRDFGDGVTEPAVGMQMEEDASLVGDFHVAFDQTASIAFVVFQRAEGDFSELFFGDVDGENAGVECLCPIQVGDRDVEPDGPIVAMLNSLVRRQCQIAADSSFARPSPACV